MPDIPKELPPEPRPTLRIASRLFIGLVLLVSSYSIYMVASQMYWDWRVRRLCEAEGGVKVFVPEKIRIEARYMHWSGEIDLPVERNGPGDPLPWERKEDDHYFLRRYSQTIQGGDPVVWRATAEVVRTSDNFVLGRGVMFGRAGGDIFPIDSSSQFTCPSGVDRKVINEVFAKPGRLE